MDTITAESRSRLDATAQAARGYTDMTDDQLHNTALAHCIRGEDIPATLRYELTRRGFQGYER